MNALSTCKSCLNDFPTDDLIWGDKGNFYLICTDCNDKETNDLSQESISWQELAELTHTAQVATFGWCSCEDSGTLTYNDCPTKEEL